MIKNRKIRIQRYCRRFVLVIVIAASTIVAAAQPGTAVRSVDSVAITVSDMDRAVDFYSRVLTFQKMSDVEVTGEEVEHLSGVFGVRIRVVRMKLGEESIELDEYLAPRGRPIPLDSRSNDRWFQHIAIIVSDMEKAYTWLRQNKVEFASSGPQVLPDWNINAAGISAFYFKDPDEHPVEILHFPTGKGADKWHKPTNKLFLGIDHTAIVVWDTDASLRFYRDALGLRVAGESENYGTEQEHLNNIFGAHLRITALRAASGPGVEFLEYIAPRDGRPYPGDACASDLFAWQTNFVATDVRDAEGRLRAGKFAFISPGAVDVVDEQAAFRRGLSVRDPDGHISRVLQK